MMMKTTGIDDEGRAAARRDFLRELGGMLRESVFRGPGSVPPVEVSGKMQGVLYTITAKCMGLEAQQSIAEESIHVAPDKSLFIASIAKALSTELNQQIISSGKLNKSV